MSILQQQPEGEILGMGGPWVGKLFWQRQPLPGTYVLQDEVVDSQGKYVLVVETNEPHARARHEVVFWLVAVEIANGQRYRSQQSWPALYVEKVADGQIELYASFHVGKPEQKQRLPFNLVTHFQPIS